MSPSTTVPTRFGLTPHLVDLEAEAERLAGRVRAVPADVRLRLAPEVADEAVLATLRLDGATLERLPDLEDALSGSPTGDATRRRGTWFDAMRALDEVPDERVQALEVLGVRAGLGSDDLGERLLLDTMPALVELHRRLTHGLVADRRAGMPREVDLAVHDASTGRVLYFPTDPRSVPSEMALLGSWLASTGVREHGLVTSGVLHLELLRIHPFDAANGRLARTAARLVLRAHGLDPDGLSCPEPGLEAHALGYLGEVASTRRRRDATVWLERWGEAVTAGLRTALRRLGTLQGPVPERGRAFLEGLETAAFTLADYRAGVGVPLPEARADLTALLETGRVERVPGSRGLRFVHVPE